MERQIEESVKVIAIQDQINLPVNAVFFYT